MNHGSATNAPTELPPSGPVYKVYKRRFWGLAQLVLLNIVVSWDVSSGRAGHDDEVDSDCHDHLVVDLLLDINHCR